MTIAAQPAPLTAATAEPVPAADPVQQRAEMFALQSFFWAVAVGAHQGYTGEIVRATPSVLLTLVGTALLVRPSSVALLACVIVGQWLDVALHWPRVADHALLLAVAGSWLLLGTGLLALRARRLPSAAEVYALHAPGLRVLLLLAYALLTLAGLNQCFFDPQPSCGTTASGWLCGYGAVNAPPDASAASTAVGYGMVLIEGCIPVLLWLRGTRVLGLAVGSVFHIAVAIAGDYSFSAVMLALYVPFLGDDFTARMRAVLTRVPSAARAFALYLRITYARMTLPALLLLAVALAFVPSLLGLDPRLTERVARQAYQVMWLDPAGLLPTMLLAAWWYERAGLTHSARIGLGHPLALVPIALLALLGLCP